MKRSRRFLSFALVLIVIGLGVMVLRRIGKGTVPQGLPAGQAGDSPFSTSPRSVKTGAYYCPMHPTYTSDRPGDCPICSMKLVKREPSPRSSPPEGERMKGEGVVDHAAVHLTPEKQQLIGVKIAPVERRALTRAIRTVGTVAYDPALYQAEAEYLQALRGVARIADPDDAMAPAQALVESARLRLQVLGLSPAMIEAMADWDGPDRRLLVADPGGRVWVYATIYESELPLVAIGQTALIETPGVPGVALEGAIQAIDPILDAATRSARARVEVTDAGGVLKPGMFVDVSLRIEQGERLVAPASAVMATGTRSLVFVSHPDGVLEPREVAVGIRAEEVVEVTAGVTAGEQVVTSGNFLIDSESRLKAALEGMTSGGGHSHGGS